MEILPGIDADSLMSWTAQIVGDYVGNNAVRATELPEIITSVYGALYSLNVPISEPAAPEPLVPAISIKKSVTDDYLICLEDGKKFKSLKRHLSTAYGMTPEDYRAKWSLPRDYPMVAPSYASARSGLAKQMGLGRKADAAAPAPVEAALPIAPAVPEPVAEKAKRGRPRSKLARAA